MKIIEAKLKKDDLIINKDIIVTEIGTISHFCFNSSSENGVLRIKKDGKIIGEVTKGEYFTSYISSNGGLCKTNSNGHWEFTVFLLRAEEVDVEVTFTTELMKNKIYCGDLHSHSICSSDAVNTFKEIEEKVICIGNDFHAITDHNTYAMNFQYKNKTSNVEFIFGAELSNSSGHFNFLGKETPVDNCYIETDEDLINKMITHKKNGGYVTFNHPFSAKSKICLLPIKHEYCDFIEIWNGPWATHNKIALKWWHRQLQQNVYYPISGGSDTHNIKENRNYGNPVNCVLAPYNEQSVILSQIKKGHSYLLGLPKIIEIEFDDVIFGDKTNNNFVRIEFKAKKDYSVHVISNIDENTYSIYDMPKVFDMKNISFIRFEAYDGEECVFISNPIFSEKFNVSR